MHDVHSFMKASYTRYAVEDAMIVKFGTENQVPKL